MLKLLGILSLGHLLFGGRHHHLRRGILFGALLGFLANRNFDTDRVAEDVRKAAGDVRRTAHHAAREVRREFRKAEHERRAEAIHEMVEARKTEREERLNALHAEIEARKTAREERLNALHAEIEARKAAQKAQAANVVHALPTSGTNEAKVIRELTEDLARDARTAAMAADVPTIDFPEDDEKYFSSRKYGYVQ